MDSLQAVLDSRFRHGSSNARRAVDSVRRPRAIVTMHLPQTNSSANSASLPARLSGHTAIRDSANLVETDQYDELQRGASRCNRKWIKGVGRASHVILPIRHFRVLRCELQGDARAG